MPAPTAPPAPYPPAARSSARNVTNFTISPPLDPAVSAAKLSLTASNAPAQRSVPPVSLATTLSFLIMCTLVSSLTHVTFPIATNAPAITL